MERVFYYIVFGCVVDKWLSACVFIFYFIHLS